MKAASSGNVPQALWMIKAKCNLDIVDSVFDLKAVLVSVLIAISQSGVTALLYAVENGTVPALLDALLEAGANPDIANKDGQTPLIIAAKHGLLSCSHALFFMRFVQFNRKM